MSQYEQPQPTAQMPSAPRKNASHPVILSQNDCLLKTFQAKYKMRPCRANTGDYVGPGMILKWLNENPDLIELAEQLAVLNGAVPLIYEINDKE